MLWTLGQLRAGRALKATDLAARFEVGVRTAYRDFDFLRDEMRAPLEYDRARGSWSLTEPTAPLPPILLSEGELVALYFAEKVLAQYRGTPYEEDLTSAFRKLQALLPEEVVVRPERILSFLEIDPGPLPRADPAVFRDVLAGLTRHKRLEVRYASASSGRTLDRTVDPYRILSVGGTWYLVAWDARRRAVRDFALHRIRKVTLTDEPFQVTEGFKLDRYRADAFRIEKGGRPLNVAVRFSPRQARWIRERTWHRSARIQDRLDGGCILRLRVPLTSELTRWVLQYGPDAEVLAPKALRKDVARRAAETLAAYRGSARPGKRGANAAG
jgi:predicted DNA-binding transcriptional regulator YafY